MLNFEPMEKIWKRSDVEELERFWDCPSRRFHNLLKTIELRLGKVQKKRTAINEFWVYERCGDSVHSDVVQCSLFCGGHGWQWDDNIDAKQDLETAEMWSKMTQRLRAGEVNGVMTVL